MEAILSNAIGFVVPAAILKSTMEATGLKGAARWTKSLSAIGPGGIRGGVITLALTGIASKELVNSAFIIACKARLKVLHQAGFSQNQLLKSIDRWPLSEMLKSHLREYVVQIQDTTPIAIPQGNFCSIP